MTTSTQPEKLPSLPHVSPLRTYWEIVWRSFWVTFIFVGLSTALIEQTGTGLSLASLGLIALGCLIYSLFASAPFGAAAWIGQRGKNKVERTFPRLQRALEFLAILFFAIAIFAPAPFGELDGGEMARRYSLSHHLWDWFRFLGMSTLVLFLFRYALYKKFPLFRWVCVLAVIFAVYACVSKEIFGTATEREARQVEMRQLELANLGSEKNIIVIVIDCLQGGIAEIALREEALRQEYDDFTFFRLGVTSTFPTKNAISVLLSGNTGLEVLPPLKECSAEDTFFHDARQAGYENRIFFTPTVWLPWLYGVNGVYSHCAVFEPYQIPMLPLNEIVVVRAVWMENLYYQIWQTKTSCVWELLKIFLL